MNNGLSSNWFSLTRSCRQGCLASGILFDLIVEVLGAKIRQNGNIKGIIIEGREEKGLSMQMISSWC